MKSESVGRVEKLEHMRKTCVNKNIDFLLKVQEVSIQKESRSRDFILAKRKQRRKTYHQYLQIDSRFIGTIKSERQKSI